MNLIINKVILMKLSLDLAVLILFSFALSNNLQKKDKNQILMVQKYRFCK
jgi:hypothetical protein